MSFLKPFRIKTGSRRVVLVFKNRVIKFPKPTSWLTFVTGVMENLHERYWWCPDGVVSNPDKWYSRRSGKRHLAQIHWADRFGLCVVMERVDTLEHLDECDTSFLYVKDKLEKAMAGQSFLSDIKPSNVGVRRDGAIVMVDYGFFNGGDTTYLGRKVIEKHKRTSKGAHHARRNR